MKVLIVEPMKPCYVREISGLNDMQEIVGGHIEAIYPFKEQVAIIANEEGKILGLPFNLSLIHISLKQAWEHCVEEVHRETERINRSACGQLSSRRKKDRGR